MSAHEYTPQAKKRCAHKMKAARAKLAADEVLLVWYCPRDIAAGDVQMLPVARADASSALSALLKCHNVSSTQYPETLAFDWLLATLDADGQAEDSYCCRAGENVELLKVSVWAAEPASTITIDVGAS